MGVIKINSFQVSLEEIKKQLDQEWIFIGNEMIARNPPNLVVIDYVDLIKK